jgi:hypothetical protein
MARTIVSPPTRGFTLLPDPPAAYSPLLIDDRVRVITLAQALARAGLRISYNIVKRALVIEACQ